MANGLSGRGRGQVLFGNCFLANPKIWNISSLKTKKTKSIRKTKPCKRSHITDGGASVLMDNANDFD